jgi:hypothetical protein
MLLKSWLAGWRGLTARHLGQQRRSIGRQVESLEPRRVLADYGDAPDTTTGTARGDYQTLSANGGPSHTIVAGLFLGGVLLDPLQSIFREAVSPSADGSSRAIQRIGDVLVLHTIGGGQHVLRTQHQPCRSAAATRPLRQFRRLVRL